MEAAVRLPPQRRHVTRFKRFRQRDQHRVLHFRDVQVQAAPVLAVTHQDFADIADRVAHGDAVAKIPVVRRWQARIEATDLLGDSRWKQDAAAVRREDLAFEAEHLIRHAAFHAVERHAQSRSGVVECLRSAVDQTERRIGLKARDLQLEFARQPNVVGIKEGDVLATRCGDAAGPGRANASIVLADRTDAIAVLGQDQGRLVGRTIIDDDHFERRVRLCKRAVDGLAQIAGVVVGRDDDADRFHGRTFRAKRSSGPCRSARPMGESVESRVMTGTSIWMSPAPRRTNDDAPLFPSCASNNDITPFSAPALARRRGRVRRASEQGATRCRRSRRRRTRHCLVVPIRGSAGRARRLRAGA